MTSNLPSTFKVGDVVRISESVNSMWEFQNSADVFTLNEWCFITDIMKDYVGELFRISSISNASSKVNNSDDHKVYTLMDESSKVKMSYVSTYYFTDKMLVRPLLASERKEVFL